MTSDETLAELYDALSYARDYYRQEIGESDIPHYGYEAEGEIEAEEIYRLPPEDRLAALENVGQGQGVEGYLKAHSAAHYLAVLENQSPWLSMFADMVSGPQSLEGYA